MITKKQKQLVEKVKKDLLEHVNNTDTEMAHCNADDSLCELLEGLGLSDVVDIYNRVNKWYS